MGIDVSRETPVIVGVAIWIASPVSPDVSTVFSIVSSDPYVSIGKKSCGNDEYGGNQEDEGYFGFQFFILGS